MLGNGRYCSKSYSIKLINENFTKMRLCKISIQPCFLKGKYGCFAVLTVWGLRFVDLRLGLYYNSKLNHNGYLASFEG